MDFFLDPQEPHLQDGTCSVTWVPPVPGEYKVHVKLGGKEVHDSPFTVLVAGEGQVRTPQVSVSVLGVFVDSTPFLPLFNNFSMTRKN